MWPARFVLLAAATLVAPAARSSQDVRVIVDMDAATAGIQGSVSIPAGCEIVQGIAIHVHDPRGGRRFFSIGYLGGLDRGIAFGHVPSNTNRGHVVELIPSMGAPIHPGNTQSELLSPAHDPGFPGPEVQYLEWGADEPGLIRADPDVAVFTVDVKLSGACPGDVFSFHLLDMVTVWSGGVHGAFSTTSPINSLDTGGDAVPDGTQSAYGTDPDTALAVPPGAFRVDYVDGGGTRGPATIVVTSALDAGPAVPTGRAFLLHAVEPNPGHASMTIRFDLAAAGPVELALFDPGGRRVRTLLTASTPQPSGPHVVTWDGRDDRGRRAPAGVYFLKLGVHGRTETCSLVRLD